jgi:hypothetical protein
MANAAKPCIKRVRRHVDIHIITSWRPRAGEPDVKEQVIDEFRIEHWDGEVTVALTAAEALKHVLKRNHAAVRRAERHDPNAAIAFITTITWHNAIPGFEPPAFEVES